MFKEFTWGEFLVAMAVLNGAWYGMVLLLCYRRELAGLLAWGTGSGGQVLVSANRIREGKPAADGPVAVEESLMGLSRLPKGVEVLSSSSVAFAASGSGSREDQVGLVADVPQDLKEIFSALEQGGQGKPVFLQQVAELNERYGGIGGVPFDRGD